MPGFHQVSLSLSFFLSRLSKLVVSMDMNESHNSGDAGGCNCYYASALYCIVSRMGGWMGVGGRSELFHRFTREFLYRILHGNWYGGSKRMLYRPVTVLS